MSSRRRMRSIPTQTNQLQAYRTALPGIFPFPEFILPTQPLVILDFTLAQVMSHCKYFRTSTAIAGYTNALVIDDKRQVGSLFASHALLQLVGGSCVNVTLILPLPTVILSTSR